MTTVGFDIAGLEIFLPLLHGAVLVLADEETARDPHALLHRVSASGITMVQATPSLWQGSRPWPGTSWPGCGCWWAGRRCRPSWRGR